MCFRGTQNYSKDFKVKVGLSVLLVHIDQEFNVAASCFALLELNRLFPTYPVSFPPQCHYYVRQGPSGPAFRTHAAGASGTTGHTRSQY